LFVVNSSATALPPETEVFYRKSMRTLAEAGIPFMVGGAYAFGVFTGISRHTKDLDVSCARRTSSERWNVSAPTGSKPSSPSRIGWPKFIAATIASI
jgi:hypothetical protein